MSVGQAVRKNRLWHYLYIKTLSTDFYFMNDSFLCRTSVIPLSYHCRIKFETNT